MAQSLLEQLRSYTTVVADTGDFDAMEKFRPTDATTNPSLITAAAQLPQYQPIVDEVLKQARNDKGESASDRDVANLAFQRLAVAFGVIRCISEHAYVKRCSHERIHSQCNRRPSHKVCR